MAMNTMQEDNIQGSMLHMFVTNQSVSICVLIQMFVIKLGLIASFFINVGDI